MHKVNYIPFIDDHLNQIEQLGFHSGAVAVGLFMYILKHSLGKGRPFLKAKPDDLAVLAHDTQIEESIFIESIWNITKFSLLDDESWGNGYLTSEALQRYYVEKTINRKKIETSPAYALIDFEAYRASIKNSKACGAFPRAFYDYAFELYEMDQIILDYAKEQRALKQIFKWIEKETELNNESIAYIIKAHKWAIEESNHYLLRNMAFAPSSLNYRMYSTLRTVIKQARSKHKVSHNEETALRAKLEQMK